MTVRASTVSTAASMAKKRPPADAVDLESPMLGRRIPAEGPHEATSSE
jgi:hypothetical protein